jgi:uncharacterized protein HemX
MAAATEMSTKAKVGWAIAFILVIIALILGLALTGSIRVKVPQKDYHSHGH